MKDPAELSAHLSNFIGTDTYHYNPLYSWLKYTDGVRAFANHAGGGAYWFLDIIGTELRPLTDKEDFLSIRLFVLPDGLATASATDGNNDKKLWEKWLDYSDCPPGEWKFFLQYGVLMLSSEY